MLEHIREAPYSIQVAIARERGVTVEQLLTSPYDRWAPKVLVGLLSAYGAAWVIYLAYSFFRFVDREEPARTTSRQLLSNVDTCYRRDDPHDERGEYGKAMTDYSKAIELNPNDADAYYKRGDAYHEMGEHIKAMSDYNTAIALNKDHASAYYNRGLAYRNKGEVPKAVSDLEKCIGLSTDPELTKDARQVLCEIKNTQRGRTE